MGGTSAGEGRGAGVGVASCLCSRPLQPSVLQEDLVVGVARHAAEPWVSGRRLVQTGQGCNLDAELCLPEHRACLLLPSLQS